MSKKKTTQTQTASQNTSQAAQGSTSGAFVNQNTFGQIKPEDTADISRFRDWQPQADPSIPYRFARARTKLGESFNNPLGQYTTPAIREATERAAEGDLMQQEGQAMREGQYDVNQQQAGQLGTLAALTAPRIVQTGSAGVSSGQSQGTQTGTMSGTGTGTNIQSGGLLGDILVSAAGGAGTAAA